MSDGHNPSRRAASVGRLLEVMRQNRVASFTCDGLQVEFRDDAFAIDGQVEDKYPAPVTDDGYPSDEERPIFSRV